VGQFLVEITTLSGSVIRGNQQECTRSNSAVRVLIHVERKSNLVLLIKDIAIGLRKVLSSATSPGPPTLWRVSPVKYAWHQNGCEPIHFPIEFFSLKRNSLGEFRVDMEIDHAGIRAGSTVTYAGVGSLVIYLGNSFHVPEQLKCHGLATGLVTALADSFQIAALGTIDPDMPVSLEGLFVNEGVLFATALCNGTCPTKNEPVRINQSRLERARDNLTLLTSPVKTEIAED
jgi:hypothetical protein